VDTGTGNVTLLSDGTITNIRGVSVYIDGRILSNCSVIEVGKLYVSPGRLYIDNPSRVIIHEGVGELYFGTVDKYVLVCLDWSNFRNLEVENFDDGQIVLFGYLQFLTNYPDARTWGSTFLGRGNVREGEICLEAVDFLGLSSMEL
jgi:hypothetical protein